MHTAHFTSTSTAHRSPWDALLHSKWACMALVAGGIATASTASRADEFNTVLGAGVGAFAGAVIGQSVGGRNGAIIGAGAGGLVGASIAQRGAYPYAVAALPIQPVVSTYPSYPSSYRYPAQAYYAPPTPVVYQPPAYYAPPPAVVYRVESWRPPQHHDHGRHRGWDRDHRERRDYRGLAPAPRYEQPFIDGRGDQERMRRDHRDWRN